MFDLADVVTQVWNTYDGSGNPANVGVVAVTIGLPDGVTTATPTVNNPSTGVYNYSYTPTQPGRHTVRWVGTGVNAQGFSDVFDVYNPAPNYLISLADARATLRLTSTLQDEEVRLFIEATTAVIERHVNEIIAPRNVVEDYTTVNAGRWGDSIALRTVPVISVQSMVSVSMLYTWSPANFHVNTDTGEITNLPTTWPLWGDVTINYTAGRQIIPANYLLAAKIIVQHLWQTRRGVAGAVAPAGMVDTMHGSGRLGWGYAIPNAAIELLGYGTTGIA